MKIKSYNIELTDREIFNLHKLLGSMSDIEFGNMGIVSDDRECLRLIYHGLTYLIKED